MSVVYSFITSEFTRFIVTNKKRRWPDFDKCERPSTCIFRCVISWKYYVSLGIVPKIAYRCDHNLTDKCRFVM